MKQYRRSFADAPYEAGTGCFFFLLALAVLLCMAYVLWRKLWPDGWGI